MTPIEAFDSFSDGFISFSEAEPHLLNATINTFLIRSIELIPKRLEKSRSELVRYQIKKYPSEAIEHIKQEIREYEEALKKYLPGFYP